MLNNIRLFEATVSKFARFICCRRFLLDEYLSKSFGNRKSPNKKKGSRVVLLFSFLHYPPTITQNVHFQAANQNLKASEARVEASSLTLSSAPTGNKSEKQKIKKRTTKEKKIDAQYLPRLPINLSPARQF